MDSILSDKNGKKIARGGIIDCGGIKTKHYLKEEIISTADRFNFRVIDIQKFNYPWSTEFIAPPEWMKDPTLGLANHIKKIVQFLPVKDFITR